MQPLPTSCHLAQQLSQSARSEVRKTVPATELVPGDSVKLSLGGVVAADVKLVYGSILLDQSMLTGESVPIEAGAGLQTYVGALVRRGEATAKVTATGARTKFGHTADLVRAVHVESPTENRHARAAKFCRIQWSDHRSTAGIRTCPRHGPLARLSPWFSKLLVHCDFYGCARTALYAVGGY